MIDRYIAINRLLRGLHARCQDGMAAERIRTDGYAQNTISGYIARDVRDLERIWPRELGSRLLDDVRQAAAEANHDAYYRIVNDFLPDIEDRVDEFFAQANRGDVATTILDFLHTSIIVSSYEHYRAGHFRDAVLNGVVAVFDLIRERTGVDKDGVALVSEVFSTDNPQLVFSTVKTESGKNDQKGFLLILQGTYIGIRNPKAHSLGTDLDQRSAGQYLAFLSLLARRVEQASATGGQDNDG
jgi:uncharacterized protein (TIGR02391 family)